MQPCRSLVSVSEKSTNEFDGNDVGVKVVSKDSLGRCRRRGSNTGELDGSQTLCVGVKLEVH